MKNAAIGLGSNLGNRLQNLRRATSLLCQEEISVKNVSCIYETEAVTPEGSPPSWNLPYLNGVLHVATTLSPQALHKQIKHLEKVMGRDQNAPRWSPRIIDYDLLFYEDTVIDSETLQIPHPQFLERFFTLIPTAQLFPYWKYPDPQHQHFGKTLLGLSEYFFSAPTSFKRALVLEPKLVGIVNITPDSFSDGNQFLDPEKALSQIVSLQDEGASVIELGAQSTRPGAPQISPKVEWERLAPIFECVHSLKDKQLEISLDSYSLPVIEQALAKYPIHWINDVSGSCDENILDLVAQTGSKIVLMHSLGVPPRAENTVSTQCSPLEPLITWGEKEIAKCLKKGLSQEQIVLDPGIGFGKQGMQSWHILSQIDALKQLGCKIFIGHSRKSFLKWCSPLPAYKRDLETGAISVLLSQKKVDYLRVHNIETHQRLLSAAALMNGAV